MTLAEAKKILHPDTTLDAIAEIEYYAGFNGKDASLRAVNEACIVACEAIDKLEEIKKWVGQYAKNDLR